MPETFHWVIFALHASAALVLTFSVWFRCDQAPWTTRMRVDSYSNDTAAGTDALWWDVPDITEAAACAASPDLGCYMSDLPLYERAPATLGWHLFTLLGHFEWMSAAFAFFYIEGPFSSRNWAVSTTIATAGTLVFMPWRGDPFFVNEGILLVVTWGVASAVFFAHRHVHQQIADADPFDANPPPTAPPAQGGLFQVPQWWVRAPHLKGPGNLRTGSLRLATLPALRFAEYTVTASELFVAVLSLFIVDAPAYMTIGGYALILLCNLYGAMLHYSLVADHASPVAELRCPAPPRWKSLVVPRSWLGPDANPEPSAPPLPAAHGWGWSDSFLSRRYAWGSFVASNVSTLLNSWLVYALALALVFYQQAVLFSSDPPWYVVASIWSVLLFYTSFGLWVTAVYWYPRDMMRLLGGYGEGLEETYLLVVRGLDTLSVMAKLSVVSFLSFGFVFSADGRC
jgi:hypothetical protein